MKSDNRKDPEVHEVDLHLHTTHSDGMLSPTELVDLCARNGLKVIAISDHDSTEGVAEAQAAAVRHGIEVIPAIELSTDVPDNEIHMLGYFIDMEDTGLPRTYSENFARDERTVAARWSSGSSGSASTSPGRRSSVSRTERRLVDRTSPRQ